MLTSSHRD
uniref:Uncharacterized protein n=1 Tax=Anguilla anguilla TaxID=7936 RepID=A0A0E9SBY9_ANGAN